ncbi:MAG TPA: PAS domain-containing protein [Pseudomonadota bacterium]|nr:PAS domain-containing protein [Pseudomonadota bacterium]
MLAKLVLSELFKERPDNHALRVWVPGCATGKEVYSLAVLLLECMAASKRPFVVQLFSTDLNNEAISTALVFKQSEVQTKEGQWYLTRIMPYRTAENLIDGLVLTFVDINPVKETQKTLRRMSKVFTVTLDPVLILDLAGRVIDLNEEAARHYGFSRDELLGQPVATIVPRTQRKAMEAQLQRRREGESQRNVECVRVTKGGQELPCLTTLALLTDERGQPEAMVVMARQGLRGEGAS